MWEAAPYSTPPTADENGKIESEAITVSPNFLKLVKVKEKEEKRKKGEKKQLSTSTDRLTWTDRESCV